MITTEKHDVRMANMTFSSVYPLYITKVENKGRSKEELDQTIEWLTGFDAPTINNLIEEEVTFKEFFSRAKLNPNSKYIKGLICGYRVEDIENPLTKKVRYVDKLVDELAKGKALDKVLRAEKDR